MTHIGIEDLKKILLEEYDNNDGSHMHKNLPKAILLSMK